MSSELGSRGSPADRTGTGGIEWIIIIIESKSVHTGASETASQFQPMRSCYTLNQFLCKKLSLRCRTSGGAELYIYMYRLSLIHI